MTDRSSVIEALEEAIPFMQNKGYCAFALTLHDAVELLEAQEPVRPVKQIEQTEWTVCGNCHNHLISKWIFCPYCGKAVKWDVVDTASTVRGRRNPSLDVNPPRIVPKNDKEVCRRK